MSVHGVSALNIGVNTVEVVDMSMVLTVPVNAEKPNAPYHATFIFVFTTGFNLSVVVCAFNFLESKIGT